MYAPQTPRCDGVKTAEGEGEGSEDTDERPGCHKRLKVGGKEVTPPVLTCGVSKSAEDPLPRESPPLTDVLRVGVSFDTFSVPLGER